MDSPIGHEQILIANLETAEWQRNLENLVKHLDPTLLLKVLLEDPKVSALTYNKIGFMPEHYRLLAYEACAAVSRGHPRRHPTRSDIAKIWNHLNNRSLPLLQYHADSQQASLFFEVLSRQQIEAQDAELDSVAIRLARINRMSTLIGCNPDTHMWADDLSISDVLAISLLLHLVINIKKRQSVFLQGMCHTQPESVQKAIKEYFRLFSRTHAEVRQDYQYIKDSIDRPLLRDTARPAAYTRPFVMVEQEEILPLLPGLICDAPARVFFSNGCKSIDKHTVDIGFERYVREIINDTSRFEIVGTDKSRHNYKHVDFVISDGTYFGLVECKNTSRSAKFITESTLSHDTSTKLIRDACSQIVETVRADPKILRAHRDLRLFSVICIPSLFGVYGSDDYWNKFVLDSNKLTNFPIDYRPQIMSITGLEMFLHTLKGGLSPIDLINEYTSGNYVSTGEWSVFMGARNEKLGINAHPAADLVEAKDSIAQTMLNKFTIKSGTESAPLTPSTNKTHSP